MDRIACVTLPEFPLQLLLRRHPEWAALPAAVVDRDASQGVILWVNDRARHLRILPGMRYGAALSLSPHLRAGVVAEKEIETATHALTERLRFFTADVEPSPPEPGVFWLNASGLSLLYPSLGKWAGLIRHNLTESGMFGSVAVGFSRFATYAVSRTTAGVTLFENDEAERTAAGNVRIDRLDFDPELRDALHRLGITTVGRFLSLPSNGVKKRFGADVHRLYQLARGELFSPLTPLPPQEPVIATIHLDDPEGNMDRLMAVVEKSLHTLFTRLAERGDVLAAIVTRLTFDDGGKRSERLQPASPTLDLLQVVELLRLRIAATPMTSGITSVELELEGTPAMERQCELFVEKSPRDLAAAARAFARMRAEFGDDAVVCARLRDAHLPEARFEWEPVTTLAAPRPRDVKKPPLVRRMYTKPVVFSPARQRNADRELTAHIDNGTVRETVGPYVVSGGWWAREVQREYYFVRTASGRSLWMYYDRRRLCWFIHGEVE